MFWVLRFFFRNQDDQFVSFFCLIVMLTAYTCKDLLRPSIGKRIMRLKIVTVEGSDCISARKLLQKNLSFGISPLAIVNVAGSVGTQREADKQLGIAVIEE